MKNIVVLILIGTLSFFVKAQGKFGGGSGDGYTMEVLQNVPLSIELISFEAIYTLQNQVLLKWVTKRETNNAYFEVQKSSDLISWETLIKIEGKYDSNVNQHYQVFDNQPYNPITYYRLKQVDFDGKYTYSFNIFLNHFAVDSLIKVFPNPAKDIIFIQASPYWTNKSVFITDIKGKMVLITNHVPNYINISHLTGGVYILKIGNFHYRIIKKNE